MMFPPFISRAASAERRSTNWTKPHPCAGSEKIKEAAMRPNEEEDTVNNEEEDSDNNGLINNVQVERACLPCQVGSWCRQSPHTGGTPVGERLHSPGQWCGQCVKAAGPIKERKETGCSAFRLTLPPLATLSS